MSVSLLYYSSPLVTSLYSLSMSHRPTNHSAISPDFPSQIHILLVMQLTVCSLQKSSVD